MTINEIIKTMTKQSDILWLCDKFSQVMNRLQISSTIFWGEKEDSEVLDRIENIRRKNKKL